jgi:uncharacterized protein YegP (UPF0339 family)
MAGKFVLARASNGKFHFNLLAGNGQIIATSQLYANKEAAENGIESVRTNAPGAIVEDKSEETAAKPSVPKPSAPKHRAPAKA